MPCSSADMLRDPPLSSNPLEALGESLFTSILQQLAYRPLAVVPSVSSSWHKHSVANEASVWRGATLDADLDPDHLAMIRHFEGFSATQVADVQALPGTKADKAASAQMMEVDQQGKLVAMNMSWKRHCEWHIVSNRNWQTGRCSNKWLEKGWGRAGLEEMDGYHISTYLHRNGLDVIDLRKDKTLFSLPDVPARARLAVGMRHVVVDVSTSYLSLQVYRMQLGVKLALWPYPILGDSFDLPSIAASSKSQIRPTWDPKSTLAPEDILASLAQGIQPRPSPLPQGGLAYYRKITELKPFIACTFIIRQLGEDIKKDYLAIGSDNGVPICSLDDIKKPEVVPMPAVPPGTAVTFDFNESHIFFCGVGQVHIYDRQSRPMALSFPSLPTSIKDMCALAYHVRDPSTTHALIQPTDPSSGTPPPGWQDMRPHATRADVQGMRSDDQRCDPIMRQKLLRMMGIEGGGGGASLLWPPIGVRMEFSACRVFGSNLVVTTTPGQLYFIRDYAALLALADTQERQERWGKATIIIYFPQPIRNLDAEGTHIVVSETHQPVFIDTRCLPLLPLAPDTEAATSRDIPAIHLHLVPSFPMMPPFDPHRAPTFHPLKGTLGWMDRNCSTTAMTLPNPYPEDPLQALGDSLFVTILSNLPITTLAVFPAVCRAWRQHSQDHKSGIWRAACHRAGMDRKVVATLLDSEKSDQRGTGHSAEAARLCGQNISQANANGLDWKAVCRRLVVEGNNWRGGRCKEEWVYPHHANAVCRFKMDEEQEVCISTSRTGGIEVVDLESSHTLFSAPHVRPYAHIEFAKGHVVFDTGNMGGALQVWRTKEAINRSPRPWPSERQVSAEAQDAVSHIDHAWRPTSAILPSSAVLGADLPRPPTLPRGALAYYRNISAPTYCNAFRARVDGRESGTERAVLGTAGNQAIYLWDLEDEGSPAEVIPTDSEAAMRALQYIEFDDNYVFLCGDARLYVYCRSTKKLIHTYPPRDSTTRSTCAAAYYLEMLNRNSYEVLQTPADPSSRDPSKPGADMPVHAVIARADVPGCRPSDPEFVDTMYMEAGVRDRLMSDSGGDEHPWPPVGYDFTACHYTASDLICTTGLGQILITRDYASVLTCPDANERSRRWAARTIAIGLRNPIMQLAVEDTRVTVSSLSHIYFFDTNTLPTLPLSDSPATPIRIYAILSTQSVNTSSCVQIHRSKLFYAYDASGEPTPEDPTPDSRHVLPAPERAREHFGKCIRVWDFS